MQICKLGLVLISNILHRHHVVVDVGLLCRRDMGRDMGKPGLVVRHWLRLIAEKEIFQLVLKRNRRSGGIGLFGRLNSLNVPFMIARRLISLLMRLYGWLIDGRIVIGLIDMKRLDSFPASVDRRRCGIGLFVRIACSRIITVVELRHRFSSVSFFELKCFE